MKRLVVLGFLVAVLPASATTVRILPSQDAWPVWSPGGGRIAFTRIEGNSMSLEILTLGKRSTVAEVARNGGQLSPSWSSDGTRLAYASGGRIYTVGGDGRLKRMLPLPGAAFAPSFRPGSGQVAYLTTHGARNTDLWVDTTLWARNAIGRPSWNADGTLLAFQREDGIYVLGAAGSERRLASIASPGPPIWNGDDVVFPAQSRIWKVSAKAAGAKIVALTPKFADIGSPTFDADSAALFYNRRGGVGVTTPPTLESALYIAGAGLGVASAPAGTKPPFSALAYAGPHKGCPGHLGLRLRSGAGLGSDTGLTGTCDVLGTPGADVIEGTPREGDVILALAGNDKIHANDGHTDTVNCGPGRDTVWADRTDRLTACEIVHR